MKIAGIGKGELPSAVEALGEGKARAFNSGGRERRATKPGGIGFGAGALMTVSALAPLPFGATDPVSSSVFCFVLAVGLLFARLDQADVRRRMLLHWMVGLVAAYALVIHEQISTNPWFAHPDPIWAQAGKILKVELPATASVIRWQPLFALGNTLCCIEAVCLGIIVGSDRLQARTFLSVVAWSGACYGLYGIASTLIEPSKILWLDRPGYIGNVTGTFINRNTAATYFGCATSLWFLMLAEGIKTKLPRGELTYERFAKYVLQHASRKVVIPFLAFSVCLIALLMTSSRAGVSISLAALILSGFVTYRSVIPRRVSPIWILIGGGLGAIALLELLGGAVNNRFNESGLSDEGRLAIYRSMINMIFDHPWVGTGLGTFPYIFPNYRQMPPDMQGTWVMGHSTPLEMASELGLPLTGLVGLTALLGMAIMIHGAIRRQRDSILPLAGAVVLGISAGHSCIDFSLQIPGFAIVAMSVVGVGLAQSFSTKMDVVNLAGSGAPSNRRSDP